MPADQSEHLISDAFRHLNAANKELPAKLPAFSEHGLWAAWAALPVLLAGVYTTAAPLLFGVSERLGGSRKAAAGAALAGWLCSALPFQTLVGGLFPVIGWFGLAMIACRAAAAIGKWGKQTAGKRKRT